MSVLWRTPKLIIIKTGRIRKDTCTCRLWEKGQSQQEDQPELTEAEQVFRREQMVHVTRSRGADEEAKWWSGINLWGQETAMSFCRQYFTPSWHLFLPYWSHFLFAKGRKKAHKRFWVFNFYLHYVLFIWKSSLSSILIWWTINCGSTPTQWIN